MSVVLYCDTFTHSFFRSPHCHKGCYNVANYCTLFDVNSIAPLSLRLVKVNIVSASDGGMENTDLVCRFQSAAHFCNRNKSLQCIFPSICVLHACVEYVSAIKYQF